MSDRLRRLVWLAYVWAFFVFVFAPIAIVVVVAFQEQGYVAFPIRGYSLRWFEKVFAYKPFIDGLVTSFEVAALASVGALLLGTPAALALARHESRTADAAVTFLLSPLAVPLIVVGFAMLFYLSRFGLGTTFLGLLIAHTVVSIPYVVRTTIGVYRAIGREIEEAAEVLGATRRQVLWYVTLPAIRPGLIGGALLSFLISIDNLPVSYFFSSVDTVTLPVVMLSYMESSFDPSIAALSVVQLLIAFGGLLLVDRVYGIRSLSRTI
ncbi:MAG TPA: ABC transporter permease [Thermodesulfobacteriota bacterium]